MSLPPRARVRDLVLRLLGVVHLIAFLSLWVQLDVLMGSRGLLPAGVPDAVLHAGAALGVVASLALIAGLAPRLVLAVLWGTYLAFTTAGSRFFEFQWDSLLLEATFVSWFAAPWGWRPRGAPGPGPAATLLLLGLVFKLHVESGLAKLVSGDPTWRDFTAMATYYETAPLPTPLSWWAHQLPLGVHQATSVLVLLVEVVAPVFVIAPRRLRGGLFCLLAALQVGTQLTGNYGFFNLLTLVLCVFVLDDSHLPGGAAAERPPCQEGRFERGALVVWVLLSIGPFVNFCGFEPPLLRYYEPLRTINAYHLFAGMTLVRREVVIEGSLDGTRWEVYEFHHKPGDPTRAPSFVAPHQPRVDFLLWFARLGRHDLRYLEQLVARLLDEPDAVRGLFARMPFEGRAPRYVRVVTYQYGFTDRATRAESGAWWFREWLPRETSEVMTRVR